MPKIRAKHFTTDTYLAGPGETIIRVKAKQIFSHQGDRADCRVGRAKLTIVSKVGKEAAATAKAVRRVEQN